MKRLGQGSKREGTAVAKFPLLILHVPTNNKEEKAIP